MTVNAAGALINSALYLICTFVAGLVTGHPMAWKLSLASMGTAFFGHVYASVPNCPAWVTIALVFTSWGLGGAVGLLLLA